MKYILNLWFNSNKIKKILLFNINLFTNYSDSLQGFTNKIKFKI